MNGFVRTWIRPLSFAKGATVFVTVGLSAFACAMARADVNTFSLRQPLNNATVRETVPIRVSRTDMANAAYATITIDGVFRSAHAVPDAGDILYVWDTKSAFTTPDNPDTQLTTVDGPHTLEVQLFDHDSSQIADATSKVRVANRITTLPDGIHLIYKWAPNEDIDYGRKATVNSVDAGGNKTPMVSSDIVIDRNVEDISNGEILLRDQVLDNGLISLGQEGIQSRVQTAYNIGSKYWTVDKFGRLLTDNRPVSGGSHFGFEVPEFPARRVNVGDSWQTHLWVSPQWASDKPTFVRGTAHIDDFEWEDGYPTAKIIETYDGPALFNIDSNATIAPFQAGRVQINRTVWFAYEAGIVVRVTGTTRIDAEMSSTQYAALSGAGTAVATPQTMVGGGPGDNGMGGNQGNPLMQQQGGGFNQPAPGAPNMGNPIADANTDAQRVPVSIEVDETLVFQKIESS